MTSSFNSSKGLFPFSFFLLVVNIGKKKRFRTLPFRTKEEGPGNSFFSFLPLSFFSSVFFNNSYGLSGRKN